MRRAILLLVLLGGCPQYEITITTIVNVAGHATRTLVITEKEEGEPWHRFAPPTAPYAAKGANRFEAALAPGRHPNGIRYLLAAEAPKTAEAAATLPATEGDVVVESTDLYLGRLVRYHETIAIGADPEHVRKELPRMLKEAAAVSLDALALRFPDVDVRPLVRHVEETLVPRIARDLLVIRDEAALLIAQYRANRYGPTFAEWRDHPGARRIVAALGRLGIRRKPDAAPPQTFEELFSDLDEWEFGNQVVAEAVATLDVSAERRVEIARVVLHPDEEMKKNLELSRARHYPSEEEQARLEAEGGALAIAAVGAYLVRGLVDTHHFSVSVRMPGTLLFANGDLGAAPEVRWRLVSGNLFVLPPEFTAYSFVPESWAGAGPWNLDGLLDLQAWVSRNGGGKAEAMRALARALVEKGYEKAKADAGELAEALDLLKAARG